MWYCAISTVNFILFYPKDMQIFSPNCIKFSVKCLFLILDGHLK